MNDGEKFLLYKQADHIAARENPYVRDLVAWLSAEGLRGEQAAVNLLRAGREKEAYYAAAKAEALDEIWKVMHRADPHESAPEREDFIDDRDPMANRRKK